MRLGVNLADEIHRLKVSCTSLTMITVAYLPRIEQEALTRQNESLQTLKLEGEKVCLCLNPFLVHDASLLGAISNQCETHGHLCVEEVRL